MSRKQETFVCFFICLVFLTAAIIGNTPHYETGDDIMINFISAGAFGAYRLYLVHTGVLYACVLMLFNLIAPSVPWYFILLLALNLLSVFTICNTLSKKLPAGCGAVVTVLLNIVLYSDFYVSLQYTKNAYLYTIAGTVALFAWYRDRETNGKPVLATACLLLFCGLNVRDKCFLFLLPFLLLLFVSDLLKKHRADFPVHLKRLAKDLAVPALILIVSYGVHLACYQGADWQTAVTLNRTREHIMDYTGVDYEAHREAYTQAGITQTQLMLFRRFLYADPETFTPEMLKTVEAIESADGSHSLRLDAQVLSDTLAGTGNAFTHFMAGILALCCLVFLFLAGSGKTRLFTLCNLLLFFAEYYFLYCRGRPYWRASIGLFLALGLFPLTFYVFHQTLPVREDKLTRMKPLLYLSALVLTVLFAARQGMKLGTQKDGVLFVDTGNNDALFAAIREDKEHRYVGFENYFEDDPWQITAARFDHYFDNFCFTGDWFAPSPLSMREFHAYGIDNPLRALVTRDDVLFFGPEENADLLAAYFREIFPERNITLKKTDTGFWQFDP